MLTISDPNLSVDLDNPDAGLSIAKNGWSQETPNAGAHGIFYDVEEKISIAMLDARDEDRSLLMQDIALLGQRAEQLQSADHVDHLNPAVHVVMMAQTPTELTERWALVKSIKIDKLSTMHYAASGYPRLALEITREGLWRGKNPTESPTSLAYTTLRATSAMGNGCHVTIDPAVINGDAPGLCMFALRKASNMDGSRVVIVRKTATTTAELDLFKPFHWVDDATTAPPTVTVAAMNAVLPVTMDTLPVATVFNGQAAAYRSGWKIDPKVYNGRFTVYGIYTADEEVASAKVTHGFSGSQNDGDWKPLVNLYGSSWTLVNLGQVHIPAGAETIRGNTPTVIDYEINLWVKDATTKTFFAGIAMVPVDEQSLATQLQIAGRWVRIDGEISRCYYTMHSGGDYAGAAPVYGRFPTIQPGVYNRFYMLPDDGFYATGSLLNPTININFALNYIPRFMTISTTL